MLLIIFIIFIVEIIRFFFHFTETKCQIETFTTLCYLVNDESIRMFLSCLALAGPIHTYYVFLNILSVQEKKTR